MANSVENVNNWVLIFKTVSDVLTAGLAITTFSLFLYSLTFKIRDQLINIYSGILFTLILIFGADAFGTITNEKIALLNILKIHWLGLIAIPTLYFLFSDALLALTGKPSHGKRRIFGFMMIATSCFFCVLLLADGLLGELIVDQKPAPYFLRTKAMDLYLAFFFSSILLSLYNFFRAIRRTNSPTSKRRMIYLVVGAIGLFLGLFPYLIFESSMGVLNSLTFWILSCILYLGSWILLSTMTYSISFFGLSVPDREIKSRLFHWIFRGPLTASVTLGLTTLIRRIGYLLDKDLLMFEILAMVACIMLLEHAYTILFPKMEKILFRGKDLQEMERIRSLEARLFTRNDLNQFAEIILAALCDRMRASNAVLFLKPNGGYENSVEVGNPARIIEKVKKANYQFNEDWEKKTIFYWNGIVIIPIKDGDERLNNSLISGFIGLDKIKRTDLDPDQVRAVNLLLSRLHTAIVDYQQQQKVLYSLELLEPQMVEIQNLLAAGRFTTIAMPINLEDTEVLNRWAKDALSHLWGGPKLSGNPLMQLAIVQQKAHESGETLTKALRELLQGAIASLKPEGERQYTNDWLLYNILDFKFNGNMKMRDIAKRLALSEADLYRKQRIAIDGVVKKIIDMETTLLKNNQKIGGKKNDDEKKRRT
ncbi:MAG TPA: hypothetical protein PLL88_03170 [Anaerolineaceae bacterium]|nr:hypothetical protein [Anaerolineaceae bacterium]